MELVETLRRWARWLKRAQDLGLQVPDPSILLRGLEQAAKTQLEKHGEVAFRANMLRYSLELDASPTLSSIVKFQSHLLAEFEQIAYRGRTKGSSGTTPTLKVVGAYGNDGGGSASPKGPTSPSSTAGTKPCKFFLMDGGCQRSGCKFSHDWSNVPKEAFPKKKDMNDAKALRLRDLMEDVKYHKRRLRGDVNDFLKNATQVLKMMAEKQSTTGPTPSMKMLKRVIKDYEGRMALVDSGATHPLRVASNLEWQVVVAGDGVTRMRQNPNGTLLMEPETRGAQTILPLGSLVSVLGYDTVWTKKKCILRDPEGEELALKVTSGCQELSEATVLELIAKIEQGKIARPAASTEATRQAMARAKEVQADPLWERSMREYVMKGKFEDGSRGIVSMPWVTEDLRGEIARIITDLPEDDKEVDGEGLDCQAMQWSEVTNGVENNGTVVLDIDVHRLPQLDLFQTGSSVMMLLLWGGATGRIAGIVGGLPRNNALEHSLRATILHEVASAGRGAMCSDADVPSDGVAFSLWASSESEEDESSLLWMFKWFRRRMLENHMDMCHFEQGGNTQKRSEEVKLRPGWYSRMVKALKAVDRKAWEKHLANDHVPYRPDCLQCIHNATGRPHRKCLHRDCYVLSADTLGPVRVSGVRGERYAVVFTYQFPKQKMVPKDHPVPDGELDGRSLDARVDEKPKAAEDEELLEELSDYVPSEDAPNEPDGELPELEEALGDGAGTQGEADVRGPTAKAAKKKEVSDDWWEFRESAGVLIRHHVTPRVTEVKYVSGGVETVLEDEEELQKDEETWEKIIGDLTKPVEIDTLYLVYPVRARQGGCVEVLDAGYAARCKQEVMIRRKVFGNNKKYDLTDRWEEGLWVLQNKATVMDYVGCFPGE
ncbi:hypothetical protein AK812_SmicGene40986 [Symbiodinium microadriaticum]|uniref:C3H1-type domain-containing protein n=1 Tax=Symbiodinium microadriaticum TaxID=2951 RepID=A0A1Q9C7C0_SYMMI|nr:hypothetical protein AK812_SmicGene40986 [Symbiodinium microadriaticum]CAE7388019.1 unnamed protein product [Symbiodinium sp. KB8]